MKWLSSEGFLGTMREVRTLWLSGIYGTGKTLTSVAVAGWLYENGWAEKLISNIPINDKDEPSVPIQNATVILDEAHLYLPDWKSVKAYSSFLRKVNMRLIMPSIYPPHSKLRILEIQRVFNGYRILGMLTPFWVYKWRVNAGMFSEKGTAVLWCPHDLFNTYDTDVILADNADEEILYCVQETIRRKSQGLSNNAIRIDKQARAEKRKAIAAKARNFNKSRSGETDAETFRDAANTIDDAATSIGESAERISRSLRKY